MEGVAGPVEGGLDDLQHLGKEDVAAALQDDQDGGGVALLELLCVLVELEAALLHRGQDGGAGVFTYVGMIVQDTGDGADGVAGFCSKVFDCHGGTFFCDFFRVLRKKHILETIPIPLEPV